jgi:hypothetical protein
MNGSITIRVSKRSIARAARIGGSVAGVLALVVVGYVVGVRAAAIPADNVALVYTGVLEQNGVGVTSAHTIAIELHTAQDPTDASDVLLCRVQPGTPVSVQNGRFSIPLDTSCATQIRSHPDVFVEVQVDGPAVGARTRLGAVPYAIEASNADTATQAVTATQADTATTADSATSAMTAGSASTADSATNAGHAVNADNCTNATNATNATLANDVKTLPTGAVMAFDLAACPTGWAAFTAAQNHVIVGVGPGLALDQAVGADSLALSVAQMPSHSHGVSDPGHSHTPGNANNFISDGGSINAGVGGGGGFSFTTFTSVQATGISIVATGGGQPFDNRQASLPLLYCKKQ